jgi:CBS domain-containing protein
MTLREVARSDVLTVTPATPARETAATMRDEGVGSLVVVDEGDVVGIVTDRDVALRMWEADDPAAATTADLMTEDPVTVGIHSGVYDALQTAREANVRRLPVVENGTLAGIVTLDDIIVLLAGEFAAVSEIVQAESPPY